MIKTPTAPITKVPTYVIVNRDLLEMEQYVKVCYRAQLLFETSSRIFQLVYFGEGVLRNRASKSCTFILNFVKVYYPH